MDGDFLTFQRFTDIETAHDLAYKLRQHDIAFQLEDDSNLFDPTFAHNPLQKNIRIKLQPADFEPVQQMLENFYDARLYKVDPDYYLFAFTDKELIEIVLKPDEWGPLDYQLAKQLLKERGLEIEPELASLLKEQRLADLAKPAVMHRYWIYYGYIGAILGGITGLLIGWTLVYTKKTLPDGQRIFVYRATERKHGRNILITGTISLVICTLVYLYFQQTL